MAGPRLKILACFCLLSGYSNRASAQRVTNLYSLGTVATDGQNPYGGLLQGSDGNFYGTTQYGRAVRQWRGV